MTSLSQNNDPPIHKPAAKQPIPKKFVFDFVASTEKETSAEQPKSSRKSLLLQHIPRVLTFEKPKDFQKAYESVCDSLKQSYREICEILFKEANEELIAMIKMYKIEEPSHCVGFFKDLIKRFCEKSTKEQPGEDVKKMREDYEKLLQRSEFKIRDLIRNEQIYRLGFEQYTERQLEEQQVITELHSVLQENKIRLDATNQENQRLISLVQQKEEKIKSLLYEKESASQNNYLSIQPKHETEISLHKDGKVQILATQNLKIFLNQKKKTPTNDCRITPTVEPNKTMNSFEKSGIQSSRTHKDRTLHKSGTAADLMPNKMKELDLNGLDRMKIKEVMRNQIGVYTERKGLTGSEEQGMNSSARLSEWFTFIKQAKKKKTQPRGLSQDLTTKNKSFVKLRTRGDEGVEDERPFTPAKYKTFEDLGNFIMKTDQSHDNGKSYVFAERFERNQTEHNDSKSHDRKSLTTSHKRRSVMTKSRPHVTEFMTNSQEKSIEVKSFVLQGKQAGAGGGDSGASTHRSVSRVSMASMVDHKENKRDKNSTPLMNIMMKKMAEQKTTSTHKKMS